MRTEKEKLQSIVSEVNQLITSLNYNVTAIKYVSFDSQEYQAYYDILISIIDTRLAKMKAIQKEALK
jgi:hypothetical protein